ncbi:hypothetical protein CENSYa_0389 [Cenarchaeum symbiosum A]|uniref:Roadblock/LAMTOR2 domain-containing protein n=1 Tax=Cenarchaeum symbiosum (strain A) TaxID=414004 RepID=A0RUK8_CENSY|nr:hypothetical protein CENSYa_0389 [Cenarchaeum symbiosum A]
MEVEIAVKKLLAMNKAIRVVTICDMSGKLVFTGRRKTVTNVLSPKESKESLRISARNMKGRKKLSKKLGQCRYTLAEYDKIKRLVMPAGKSHLFFITCTPRYDHNKIVKKIRTFKD